MPEKRSHTPLDWEDHHLLLAVMRRGRLADGARELGIDPTTVGRRLSALEAKLGAPAFERTPEGLTALPWTRELLSELEQMESAALGIAAKIAAARAPAHGRVRIAISDAFAMHFLAAQMSELARDLPGIELELVTSAQMADLRRREADVALRFARPASEEMHGRRVASVRWTLYGATSYLRDRARVDPEDGLRGHSIIRWTGPALRPAVTGWLDAHAQHATTTASSASLHVMIELCAQGVGLAILPGAMARARGGMQRALDVALDDTELWIVVHRDARRIPRVRAVADRLAAKLDASRDLLRAI